MPRAERGDRGVERGGVAEAGVLVAGGERAGNQAERAAAGEIGATEDIGFAAALVGGDDPRRVRGGAGDVAVDVDAAWHDDESGGVDRLRGANLGISGRRDDPAVFDPEIAHLPVDAVGWVVELAVGDAGEGHVAGCSRGRLADDLLRGALFFLSLWRYVANAVLGDSRRPF